MIPAMELGKNVDSTVDTACLFAVQVYLGIHPDMYINRTVAQGSAFIPSSTPRDEPPTHVPTQWCVYY